MVALIGVLVSFLEGLSEQAIPVCAMGKGLAAQVSVGYASDKGMAE